MIKLYLWDSGRSQIGSAVGIGETEEEAKNNIKNFIRDQEFSDRAKDAFLYELDMMFLSTPKIVKGACFWSDNVEELYGGR